MVSAALLAYLGSTGLFTAVLWAYGRAIAPRNRRRAVRKFSRAVNGGLFALGVGQFLLLFAMGVPSTAARTATSSLGVGPGGLVGSLAGAVAIVVPPALAVFVAYLPTVGHFRRLRDLDLTTAYAAGRMARFLVYIVVVATAGMTLYLQGPSGATLVVATVLGFLLLYAAGPYIVRLTTDTTKPDAETAARLADVCDRIEFDPAEIRILQLDDEESATVTVRGVPGRRSLFVSSHLCSTLDDDRLAALLAVNAEHVHRWHYERRMGWLVAFVVVGMAGVFDLFPGTESASLLLAVVGMLVVVALAWRGRTVSYRADAAAAERVGSETVLAAFQTLIDRYDAPTDHGRLATLIQQAPPLGSRMDRLRPDRGHGGPAHPPGPGPQQGGHQQGGHQQPRGQQHHGQQPPAQNHQQPRGQHPQHQPGDSQQNWGPQRSRDRQQPRDGQGSHDQESRDRERGDGNTRQ